MSRSYFYLLVALVIIFTGLTGAVSTHKMFNQDEFEHVHAAWYVKNHHLPYTDFFEDHHPLLWYTILPFLSIFGDTVQTVEAVRLFMFFLTLGIVALTYLISLRATGSRETSLISVILLLTIWMFIESSIEIRPDVPQVLFGMGSIYCLVRSLQTRSSRFMFFSGLAAAVSFLYLQKALFLLAAYAPVFTFFLWKRDISPSSFLRFLLGFALPLVFYAGFLAGSGSGSDYLVCNWLIHAAREKSFSIFRTLNYSFQFNGLFWFLVPFALGYILLRRHSAGRELKTVTFIGLVLLAEVAYISLDVDPWRQYFIFIIPLFCISVGHFITSYLFPRLRLREIHRMAFVIMLAGLPFSLLLPIAKDFEGHDDQLSRALFILSHTREGDPVYDGKPTFNLFRPDLHYFWYQVGESRELGHYRNLARHKRFRKLINPRHADYDICSLIESKRPKFISSHEMASYGCQLFHLYTPSVYQGIYISREYSRRLYGVDVPPYLFPVTSATPGRPRYLTAPEDG